MNCPKCGGPEKKVRVCSGCGEAFASEDLQAFSQLEYLLVQTVGWDGVEREFEANTVMNFANCEPG